MWKEHVQFMKHFFMHQFLLESQPCILLVLLDEQTKVQRDCLRTWMPPDLAGSKAHALSLDMLGMVQVMMKWTYLKVISLVAGASMCLKPAPFGHNLY